MKHTKDQEAALRYADGEKGIDHMNVQIAAFTAGVKYARDQFRAEVLRDENEDIAAERKMEPLAQENH